MIVKTLKKSDGQGLVEVIVAMVILMLSTGAVMAITIGSKNLLYDADNSTKATELAQEGMEIIKNNRSIGCSFNDLAPDIPTNPNGSCHAIESDTVSDTDAKNTSNKVISFINCSGASSPNQISQFPGFSRVIYLYDLDNPSMDWVGSANFNSTNDARNKYYYAKVKVSWIDRSGSRSMEISTIMLKRWKDQ